MRQTYNNIEIILINDGSNDNTENICKRLEQEDKRIRYFYQENSGEGGARNRGLMYVKGKYIVFVDSDDVVPEDGIYSLYLHRDYPLVIGGIKKSEYGKLQYHIPQENDIKSKKEIVQYVVDSKKMYFINTVWAKLFQADIVLNHQITFNDLKYAADTFFVYSYLRYVDKMYVVGKPVYHVISSENSMSLRKVDHAWEIMKSLYEYGQNLIEHNDTFSKFLLLNRCIKQALILQNRFSRRSFYDTCTKIKKYLAQLDIKITYEKMSLYQKVIFIGIMNDYNFFLYLFFKLRRVMCMALKK